MLFSSKRYFPASEKNNIPIVVLDIIPIVKRLLSVQLFLILFIFSS
jgi:hypothetical protein